MPGGFGGGGFGGGPGGPGGPGGFGGHGGPGGHGPGGPGPGGPGFGGPGFGGRGPGFGGRGPGFAGRGPGFGPGYGRGGFVGRGMGFGPPGRGISPGFGFGRGHGRSATGRTGNVTRSSKPEEGTEMEPRRETPAARAALHLATLSLLMGGMLLAANFLGAKIWHLWFIVQDGGVLVFPIIYVCGDILVEIYGKRTADRVALRVCVLNLLVMVALIVVQCLPEVEGANAADLGTAYGLSARVMLASIVGFFLSRWLNNWSFQMIREQTREEDFWKRSLGSSILAHILDSVVFNLIAFVGRTPLGTFLQQVFWAIIVGFALEAALNPLAKRIARKIQADIRHGK